MSPCPVKIVIINTQYVETDATSFKSVVQKLTGKDSDKLLEEAEKLQRMKKHSQSGVGSSFFMRDVSFKEFDRLLNEMPPINDIWSDTFIN
ncbi:VQ motif-containing protein 1 [Cicer arietinum]|uniref:VQ motif-containing protein 1 n=1 Tax=Cicer arietinum TaxID=3827 RepID=A0A3Q7YGV7_CICAR|nr:VQ motif-containing protein 1 [Cicer arietinum]